MTPSRLSFAELVQDRVFRELREACNNPFLFTAQAFSFSPSARRRGFRPIGIMVDRTKYDPAFVPDLALRQIFGRQRLHEDLCKAVADRKLLTVEAFAMLGDTIAAVKESLKVIIADESILGSTPGERELALTSLAAVWKTCSTLQDHFAARRAKMEEDPSKVPEIPGDDHAEFREQFVHRHPDVLLPHHREPHRKLVERLQRDFLVHGSVPFTRSVNCALAVSKLLRRAACPRTQRTSSKL